MRGEDGEHILGGIVCNFGSPRLGHGFIFHDGFRRCGCSRSSGCSISSRGRRSVSDRDLAQYASFAQTLSQSRAAVTGATGGSLSTFSFPQQSGGDMAAAGGAGDAAAEEDDEEDLYS
jgi:hypothetical protein